MTRISKRISGLVLVLLAIACSGAFTRNGHAAAVPGGTSVPSFMLHTPLFASAGTLTSSLAGAGARAAQSTIVVSIFGPGTIRPNITCYWDTHVSGGTPPYTYQWYGGSTADPSQSDIFASASQSFWLDVKVTDSLGAVGWGGKYITVTSNTGACML